MGRLECGLWSDQNVLKDIAGVLETEEEEEDA